ncbi:RagB/SusD family nutrient uptake outer membrane protein [Parabacteroides gordonii]|uniref:RagB/SusD family nutrient uptake outer membrane protein n=1 Tax=Parabacteroides gordonii TaxID=574930 RepID=UPI000EC8325A|nr:RagB/SusD family nutrient uptake outer membrane protein [Parabacteroides gordonii]RGP17522.1 RagB/SusD family nutrient uptake outer membrane protein [Parabacteroides gordonii]
MKKSIYIICTTLFTLISCTNFLEEKSTGSLTTDSELSSIESAKAFANSAYYDLASLQNTDTGWGSSSYMMLEFLTGKCGSLVSHSRFDDYKNLALDSRASMIDVWWKFAYHGIAKCNLAIVKLNEFNSLDPVAISRYRGEVHCMRAFYYFFLVRLFGDVPLVTEVQSSLNDLKLERTAVKTIYDEVIIPDLLYAENSQLPNTDISGRVSLGMVKTLLTDVYLTYAGFPLQGGKEYYSKAAAKAKEIIDGGYYSLFKSYCDLRIPDNNNRSEFIFQAQMSLDKRHNGNIPIFLPQQLGISVYSYEFGGIIPTQEYYDSFSDEDLRKAERQFFFSSYPGHPKKHSTGSPNLDNIDFGFPCIYKFFDETAILETGKSTLNIPIYRYADLLLMYAEAQVEAEGSANQLAKDCLNAIRKRAQLPDITDNNKDNFLKTVWSERYFELCFENRLWFDMLRTQKVRNDITGSFDNFVGHKTVYDKTLSEINLLLPIPQYEMETNPLLIQNTGY